MSRNIEFEFSAGGIVLDNKNRVLVIKTKNLKEEVVYTFPKGHIEEKESAEEAALREVEEETGVKAKIIRKIKDVKYWFYRNDKKIHKKVSWFLMKPIKHFSNNKTIEVEEVFWYDINKVKEILSYKSDKELVDEVIKMFNSTGGICDYGEK